MTADFFSNNRKKLRDRLELGSDDLVLIPSSTKVQYHSEQAAPFLQESNFYYLSGIEEPDCLLMMSSSAEWLLIPDEDEFAGLWDGQLSQKEAAAISGIERIIDHSEGWNLLARYIPSKVKKIYLPSPEPRVLHGEIHTNPAQRNLYERLQKDFPLIEYHDVRSAVEQLRVIKQPEEIATIRRAVNITIESIEAAMKNLKHGMYEYELSSELTYGFMKRGAQGDAYESIVAGAERACVIHYSKKNQPLSKESLVLIDAGARVGNYAADISRTYVVAGKPTSRQQEVLDAVDDVHTFALKQLKPGVKFTEYEDAVESHMGSVLKKLGIIQDASREQIRTYFPHATSHFLGLEVHDVGRRDEELREGMVLTVEPGIYIPDEKIGVRFEDDVLITKDSIENLSKKLSLQ